jgi:hypothetical protein
LVFHIQKNHKQLYRTVVQNSPSNGDEEEIGQNEQDQNFNEQFEQNSSNKGYQNGTKDAWMSEVAIDPIFDSIKICNLFIENVERKHSSQGTKS